MSYCVQVEPGAKVDLAKIDPAADGGLTKAKGTKRPPSCTQGSASCNRSCTPRDR